MSCCRRSRSGPSPKTSSVASRNGFDHHRERADRVVDALAGGEPVQHDDPAAGAIGERRDGCRGRHRIRNDDVHRRGSEAVLDVVALRGGRPEHRVEALGEREPARPQRVQRSVRGERRLEVDRVDRVDEPQGGVVPSGQQLAELAGLAHDHDRPFGVPRAQSVDDVLQPCPVQLAEAVYDAGDAAASVVAPRSGALVMCQSGSA